ncbi:Mcm10p KNAG_0L02150 [Huiozyma naganishii CBS 8797]|uniref:Uncharacterized protein n=1 Tax=Huiozyma naganishii (strain ATCC MYA-139 / BCRC 22969 / CBS 8797 / KCTC 17520 / NBRC 10181 / NCYC 3082 / Yp74L-3) TaxID=1071383 RepID=J7S3U8_HUIN7|nr:hypothetical protein KNAG_0L02150 [Kazachstania naganishii CBS 8797]CCK72832.1 hypothetical protein KNAG_0L02150 [Kazachstania naganishii CBS 8797]
MELDPRDVITADPYDNITSDEDEESKIQRELEEMERRKKDLEKRLKLKRAHVKPTDLNLQLDVQVPSSPQKRSVSAIDVARKRREEAEAIKKRNLSLALNTAQKVNLNEARFAQLDGDDGKQSVNATTSYFLEKFQQSKKTEKLEIEAQETMLSARVHTFQGVDKEFQLEAVNELEQFSDLWISKRYIPKQYLEESLRDVKLLRLNKLFAKVRPPKFQEPQYSNWAVLAIISKKSEVKFTTSKNPQKFIRFTLTNFQQQLDLFVFGDAGVKRYYNLREGDIVAVLNPEILPWRPSGGSQQTTSIKSFNLKIAHKFKCILEIGKSRDLGYCPVTKKFSNEKCGSAINLARDRTCEYHRELQMRQNSSKRLDLNGGFALGAPTKVGTQPDLFREASGRFKQSARSLPRDQGKRFYTEPSWNSRHGQGGSSEENYGLKGKFFTSSNAAKAFFDDEFQNPDMLHNLDAKRRKLQDSKKSRQLDRKLKRLLSKDEDRATLDKNTAEMAALKRTTETALHTGLIQRLGFDPTHGRAASVMKKRDSERGSGANEDVALSQKENMVNELLRWKRDKCNLLPSETQLAHRKQHRREVWRETFGKKGTPVDSQPVDNDDSDDLEIV